MSDLLENARAVAPTAAQKAALGAKLGVTSAGLWLSPLLKSLTLGAAVISGGTLLYGATPSPKVSATQASAQATPVVVSPAVEAGAQDPTESPATSPPSEGPLAAPQDAPQGEPATGEDQHSRDLPPAHAARQSGPSEAELLKAARASLATQPEQCLRLLAEHERLYPAGALAEERDVLKLRALQNSGRDEAAKDQAREFRKEHPDSLHHIP